MLCQASNPHGLPADRRLVATNGKPGHCSPLRRHSLQIVVRLGDWDSNRQAAGGRRRFRELAATLSDRDGDRLEGEFLAPPDVGTPMHLHHLQEEAMTVVAGRPGLQFAGEPPRYTGPGEAIILKRGVGHRWWKAGTTEQRCTGWATPPNNLEYFLTVFDSMKRSGGNRQGFFDAAFLLTRYRSEIRMLDIPAVVQKVAFPTDWRPAVLRSVEWVLPCRLV